MTFFNSLSDRIFDDFLFALGFRALSIFFLTIIAEQVDKNIILEIAVDFLSLRLNQIATAYYFPLIQLCATVLPASASECLLMMMSCKKSTLQPHCV